eukprot:TRINITY_DN38891_c0_g1_i1.p2 TRINITY_DN38891_c0_g1~~TRINITY_DN38891_c0_g1_i1.p2  ORF type:complete len:204 (+),score=55.82 TRINITY_DN38891_c0_g1_i1:44-613(+)
MKFSAIFGVAAISVHHCSASNLRSREHHSSTAPGAADIARAIVRHSKVCYESNAADKVAYKDCVVNFCEAKCGRKSGECSGVCETHALPLFAKFEDSASPLPPLGAEDAAGAEKLSLAQLKQRSQDAEREQMEAMDELTRAQQRLSSMSRRARDPATVEHLSALSKAIDVHLQAVTTSFRGDVEAELPS